MKIINPRKISDIYAPGWHTFLDLNHEERRISISMIPNWDGTPESVRNGTRALFGLERKGRKLREVKALLKEIAPLYEKALEKYSSNYDEDGNLIGRFDHSPADPFLATGSEFNDISRIIEKFNEEENA